MSVDEFIDAAVDEAHKMYWKVEALTNLILASQNITHDDDASAISTLSALRQQQQIHPPLLDVIINRLQLQILRSLRQPTSHLRDLFEKLFLVRNSLFQLKWQIRERLWIVSGTYRLGSSRDCSNLCDNT